MAEPGGGGGCAGEGNGSVPPQLDSVITKLPTSTTAAGVSNGGTCKVESAPGGVSNGDCTPVDGREESGSAQPESPSLDKSGKPGIPRRSSIIKVRNADTACCMIVMTMANTRVRFYFIYKPSPILSLSITQSTTAFQ